MYSLDSKQVGEKMLLMGNEAIARGAIEAGVSIAAAYPGNPSSDIIDALAKVSPALKMHVEWSINEKVALEVAASAAMSGLRGLAAMKQNGLNVASDFLLNLNLSGVRGGLVLVVCDDPSGISSTNEQDSRLYARMGELPLLEPSTFQEAKDMVFWAFELSETLELPVLVRSVTRLSHARGNVVLGPIPEFNRKPVFDRSRPFINVPAPAIAHSRLKEKMNHCLEIFETSEYNQYLGPQNPEVLLLTTGAGMFYCQEAVHTIKATERVGILKLGAGWPLPKESLLLRLNRTEQVLIVEEGSPFLELNAKECWASQTDSHRPLRFYGKSDGTLPAVGELIPDVLMNALKGLLEISFQTRPVEYEQGVRSSVGEIIIERDLTFCAGCPHRATYWAIKEALALDGRDGFVLGDIGCYGMGSGPAGYSQMNTMQAMGSGPGIASGMGLLEDYGLTQPIVAVCGDSTFFHAAIPALINAKHHGANYLLLILDNDATAMTGFQPHPGLGRTATGEPAPKVDIDGVCRAIGLHCEFGDPYDLDGTRHAILRLLDAQGTKVLILKRACALVRTKQGAPTFAMKVNPTLCLGDTCGCNRFCTRVFRCPGLSWDRKNGCASIDEAICTGCGVCTQICPSGAIEAEEL